MIVDGTLFWLGVLVAAALFATTQLVRNRTVRQVLTAVALWAVVATGLAGAAWATTGH